MDEAQESTYARRLNLWTASVDDFRSQYHNVSPFLDIKPLPAQSTDKCMGCGTMKLMAGGRIAREAMVDGMAWRDERYDAI